MSLENKEIYDTNGITFNSSFWRLKRLYIAYDTEEGTGTTKLKV
jgi:hypothetical protein